MAESTSVRLGCAGIVSDPGPFSGVPDGSLIEASNVTYRRPGVAESRGVFAWTFDDELSESAACYGVVTYDDGTTTSTYWLGSDGGTPHWRKDATSSIAGSFTFSRYKSHFAQTQGRGFFTADQSVAVLDSTSATTPREAGVPHAPGFLTRTLVDLSVASRNWLAPDYVTAYRICIMRMVNGIPMRGVPSEIRNQKNIAGGAASYVSLRVFITEDMAEGDSVEVYRLAKGTPVSTTALADEGMLRATLVVTADHITAGYAEFDDKLDDGTWNGAKLYTNASQQGPFLSKWRPYHAHDVATYNGMMFYAGRQTPQRKVLTIKRTGYSGTALTASASAFDRSATLYGPGTTLVYNITIGTPYVTFSGYAGDWRELVYPGQYVAFGSAGSSPEVASTYFPANTYVVAITALGVVTLSNNALASTGVSQPATIYDHIEVDDGTTKRRLYTCLALSVDGETELPTAFPKFFVGRDEADLTGFVSAPTIYYTGGSPDLERAWSQAYPDSGFRLYAVGQGDSATPASLSTNILLVIERTDFTGDAFTVRSSKPNAFVEPGVDYLTGVTSEKDGELGDLQWTPADEPEACPLPYVSPVGDSKQPICRILATQDALYIFKTDGIWRCYGTDPADLDIQPVDTSACMSFQMTNCATRYGDSVYAWTTKGIVEVGSFGCRNIDDAIYQTAVGPLMPSISADDAFAFSSSAGRFVAFGYAAAGPGATAKCWVYHPVYGTWSTWDWRRTVTAAASSVSASLSGGGLAKVGIPNGYGAYADFDNIDTSDPYAWAGGDIAGLAGVASVSGTSLVLTSSQWSPQAGDGVVYLDELYFVTSVTDDTHVTVDRAGIAPGILLVFEAYSANVTWTANAAGAPMQEKHFVSPTLLFSRIKGGREYTETYQGFRNPDLVTQVYQYDATASTFTTAKPLAHRSHVPSGVGRDWAHKFGFRFKQGGAFFTCDGCALTSNNSGGRV